MAEELSSLTINEIQEMATGMKRSADSLFGLLENLLEWSRLQRGLIRYSPTKFPLKKKVSETMKAVLESAVIKEIEISYHIPEDLEVFADENMIASTIRNLTSNALKFTSKGGKICISAKHTDNNEVEISVQDSGIGMDKNIIDNLFVIDGHTNRQGTEGEPSSGLGLILCKDFISKHGGKIWVESEEGKGSTFYFTLPDEIIPMAE
jgi:signal transduction histidine kinase